MSESKDQKSGQQPSDIKLPDPVMLAHAMAKACERIQPVMLDYFERFTQNFQDQPLDPMNVRDAYIEFWNNLASDPPRVMKMQADYWQEMGHIWQESMLKFMGKPSQPVVTPDEKDRRFKAPEWSENVVFDFIKQSYLLTCNWMDKAIEETRGLKAEDKKKLEFYADLFSNALSPTNFVLTNPEVLKETLKTGGENLVKGLENLVEDLERGHGELSISTTDYRAFQLGRNIATTKGKVIYQNDLMQLIQYDAQTKEVFKRPLLIIPPWINKYYILDLKAENSFLNWAVQQGYTVFTISWVNPNPKLAQKRFEDYMQEGVLAALDEIKSRTGEPDVNAVGYCLGGTLLTITLSYLASKKQDKRIASATFLTTLIDFTESGDMKLFIDDAQLALMDKEMAETGVLQAKNLQRTFSLLRANDMVWSFVINNYLMGKEPFPFDLLYWNDDSTNMPAAMHSFYLRKMYRDNVLVEPGGISMNKTPIDISKIKTPCYFLSTREDHIAPWRATYMGPQHFAGPVTFTLAASGHTAGVVNHPDKKKYCHWVNNKLPEDPEDWLEDAKQHEGSWWPHWMLWLKGHSGGRKVPARAITKSIEDAPGSYVRVRS